MKINACFLLVKNTTKFLIAGNLLIITALNNYNTTCYDSIFIFIFVLHHYYSYYYLYLYYF